MSKPVWIGIGVTVLAGAAWYIHNQMRLVDKLCFKAVGYKLGKVSLSGTQIQLKMQIRNTGNLAVTINSYKFNVYGNDNFLATVYSQGVSVIEPRGMVVVNVNVALNPKELLQSVGNILISQSSWKNIKLSFQGNLKINKGGIPFYLPITYGFTLAELSEGEPTESPC